MNKPKKLDIIAKDGYLIGTDEEGNEWFIRWCGNGEHSHWTLAPDNNLSEGRYVFIHSKVEEEELIASIRAAEHKYRIYS